MTRVLRRPGVKIRPDQLAALLLIAGYVLLAVGFGTGPIFEGPDEMEHFRYIQTILRTNQLPPPDGQHGGEYHQAPLYYLLDAALLRLFDAVPLDSIDLRTNPFYPYDISIPGNDNKNLYLHTDASETSAVARAVHLLRLVQGVLGVGTLLISQELFARVFHPTLRLTALAFVAFHPQFAYLSSVVNNDSLLILLASAVLFLLIDAHQRGLNGRRALLLGVVCGAMLITKTSGLFVGLVVLITFALHRTWWRGLPLAVLGVLAVAGWWYARNALAYQDLFLTEAWQRTWSHDLIRSRDQALRTALERWPFAYETFWARFGGGAVGVSSPLRAVWDLITLSALIGWGIAAVRGIRRRAAVDWKQGLILLSFGLCWVGASLYWTTTAWSGNQGRFLLSGITVWAIVLAGGVLIWIPTRLRPVAASLLSGGLGVLAAVALLGYFLPAYRPSPAETGDLSPLGYDYEGIAELTGSHISAVSAAPGDLVFVTLNWRAQAASDRDLRVYLHAIAPDGSPAQAFIGRDSYPGTGNFLAEDWRAGDTWAEHYTVRLASDTPGQVLYTLVAGLYDAQTETPLGATESAGEPVLPIIGYLGVPGEIQPVLKPVYQFGERIGLEAPQITTEGAAVQVCLRWLALADGEADYHIFIHLFDAEGNLLAQRDSPPLNGTYPTHGWREGERVMDCAQIEVDVSHVTAVAVGLYDPNTHTRLAVSDLAADIELPDGQVMLRAE